ncbi:hypothetical protein QOZ80_2BG0188990 [Eleusine coracana subsp. coracana]|nr:hypothetical protein QOZ80_2BG0188990 [Eleusine coracana subsp. coracana]
MAQDGDNGNQGATAGNGHGATPPATVKKEVCESPNLQLGLGIWTPVPAEVTQGEAAAYGGGATNAGDKAAQQVLYQREQRARVNKMYDELISLVPTVNKKTDKATIVGETIGFIKQLEGTLQKLEEQKLQKLVHTRQAAAAADLVAGSSSSAAPPDAAQGAQQILPQGASWLAKKKPEQSGVVAAAPPPIGFQTWSEDNIVLNVAGDKAQISVCVPRRLGVLTMVLSVMEKYHIDVIGVQVGGDAERAMFGISTSITRLSSTRLDVATLHHHKFQSRWISKRSSSCTWGLRSPR